MGIHAHLPELLSTLQAGKLKRPLLKSTDGKAGEKRDVSLKSSEIFSKTFGLEVGFRLVTHFGTCRCHEYRAGVVNNYAGRLIKDENEKTEVEMRQDEILKPQ